MGFVFGLVAACVIWCLSNANAAGHDLCNDLLQQDIVNRTAGTSQASESERQVYLDTFLSSDVDKAYEEYKKASAEQHQSSTSVKADGHYGIIGGEFDLSSEHGGAISKEDFSKQLTSAKQSGKASRADRQAATVA